MTNRAWQLAAHPSGLLQPGDIVLQERPVPAVGEGQVRIRTLYLSIDPAYRVWADTKPVYYLPTMQPGDLLYGSILGVVEESRSPNLQPGDLVASLMHIQEYSVVDATTVMPVQRDAVIPPSDYYAVLGHIGPTAYFGLMDIGRPKPGETLVVSSAAGATGALAGQFGKIQGCRVIGIAGSEERCRWIVDELGFDAAINYRTEDLHARLQQLCPDGVDVYFDNVGGPVLDTVLLNLALYARIVLCGMLAGYLEGRVATYQLFEAVSKRAMLQGFIVIDYLERYPEAFAQIRQWVADGRVRYRVKVIDGLEQLPETLNALFTGSYLGKVVLRVAPDDGA